MNITSFPDLIHPPRPDDGSDLTWVKTDSLAPIPGAFTPCFAGGVHSICPVSSLPSPLWGQALLSALHPPGISCIADAAAPSWLSQPCSGLAGLALGAGGLVCFAVPCQSSAWGYWCPKMVFLFCPELVSRV